MLLTDNIPFLFRHSTPQYLAESYAIAHHYGVAVLKVTAPDHIVVMEINDDFMHLTKQSAKKLIGLNLAQTPPWLDEGQLWAAISLCLTEQKTQAIHWSFQSADTSVSLNCSIVPVFATKNQERPGTITLILSNTTADQEFIDQISQFNYYDKLTGLPNKNYLNEILETEFSEKFSTGEVAIMLINILKFQRINESFGYAFGDQVIQKIAEKFTTLLPENALLTRFDSDKFVVLMADKGIGALHKAVENLAAAFHHQMNQPIVAKNEEVHISLTIGAAVGTAPQVECHTLIQRAHIAMKRLNIVSRDRTLFYKPELQTRANSRLKLENDLRDALKNKELLLYYQPIISLHNGVLCGFEALCRWQHPDRGMIPPLEFIPLAEETGLILPLGRWVLQESCRSLKGWSNKYPHCSNMVINVNVSGRQLLQDNFVTSIREELLKSGLPGHQLKLEITETTLIENADIVRDILLDLKAFDIALAIDDFGTGYSSLSYLNQFPVDTLKIDKSFVSRMNASKESYKIIHIISTLAQTLGLNLVAEGIEYEDQLEALRKLGCQNGQGFLFAQPLDFEQAEAYIKKELG